VDIKGGGIGWFPKAALALALAAVGCSDSPTAPSSLSRAVQPDVVMLSISGSVSLSAIGQTSQLTATARLADGSTRDVTLESQWRSLDASVATVSSIGFVTVVAFGLTRIEASHGSRTATTMVAAWAPGEFGVMGRVREPGLSGLGGVRVRDPQTGRSTTTGNDGGFFLGSVRGPSFTFERDGYETTTHAVSSDRNVDVPMQRVIRVMPGATATPPPLAPHDLSYTVGADRCYPCRLVRIVTPASGGLRLSVTWTVPRAALNVWMGGRMFPGTHPEIALDLPSGGGELVLHVGMALPPAAEGWDEYVPFTLATAVQ
jgi:hypothetical protein